MFAKVEVQVLQDMNPRTRPSEGYFDMDGGVTHTKCFSGASAYGIEDIVVKLEGARRVNSAWWLMRATVIIDAMPLAKPRPIMLFYGVTDIPSGIAYFPYMGPSGTKFGGIHSLLIRCV